MSLLDNLTQDQHNIITSLPYRVGLWISESDDAGGVESEEQELLALSNIVEGFAGEVFGSELVQFIMHETLSKKGEWDSWTADRDSILADCKLAVDVLQEHTDEKEVAAFKARLIEIAEAVALAFREYEGASIKEKILLYLLYYKEKYQAKRAGGNYWSLDEFLNISRQERGALGDLAEALDV